MLIGELSKTTGLSRDAIRFYEKVGLLPPDRRRDNRYREYSESAVQTLSFIQNMKELGFSLSEIKAFIGLFHDPDTTCKTVQSRLEDHLRSIDEKLQGMRKLRQRVFGAVELCRQNPRAKSCHTLMRYWE